MDDFRIRKFKILQGEAREIAIEKYKNIKDDDLVIISTRNGKIYNIEKIEGDPLEYLFGILNIKNDI